MSFTSSFEARVGSAFFFKQTDNLSAGILAGKFETKGKFKQCRSSREKECIQLDDLTSHV